VCRATRHRTAEQWIVLRLTASADHSFLQISRLRKLPLPTGRGKKNRTRGGRAENRSQDGVDPVSFAPGRRVPLSRRPIASALTVSRSRRYGWRKAGAPQRRWRRPRASRRASVCLAPPPTRRRYAAVRGHRLPPKARAAWVSDAQPARIGSGSDRQIPATLAEGKPTVLRRDSTCTRSSPGRLGLSPATGRPTHRYGAYRERARNTGAAIAIMKESYRPNNSPLGLA
jgi:hypothetical protein